MSAEQLEKEYLTALLRKVQDSLRKATADVQRKQDDIDEMHKHMEEHKRDMDHLEKNALREAISNYSIVGENQLDRRKKMARLLDTPYFGRIDFKRDDAPKAEEVYVGVNNFQDEESGKNMVYDWRAPISAMFYDFELGKAHYESAHGEVEGEIALKRQFRIRNGEMEYMLESGLTIHDDVLQRELNQAASGKMKNIVATIQREQNAIIRNEEARHLIIQGVAGSGKTSIALHRIAFLLYKFKDTISSDDILIISPNKVFAGYISNVLPELGEETVAETSMEDIANELFEHQIKFESFFDQVTHLLEKNDADQIERIQFKSSPELLKQMDRYLLHLENYGFNPTDIFVAKKPIPASIIREFFEQYSRLPLLQRFNEIVREIVNNVKMYYGHDIQGKERTELHATIRKMFPSTNLRMLYKDFYQWMDKPDMLKLKKGSVYEYSDVYPLLYLKMKLSGLKPFSKVKHLVVDEMQDYSQVQYQVLSALFPCKKTILGDINQSVNPFSSSDMGTIGTVFPGATCMTLLKSYRSTFQITEFTRRISGNQDIEAIERHGDEPQMLPCKNEASEISAIQNIIANFTNGNYNSLAVICKTQKQSQKIYDALKSELDLTLLDEQSLAISRGIVVTSAHLAKGLEFDEVIVPFSTAKNYHTTAGRQMLYVACTRAMHRLYLTHTGQLSGFLV